MSTEYGIFNSEGLVEQDFWSELEALRAKSAHYDEDEADDMQVYEVCGEHREHIAGECDEGDES